MPRPNSQFRSSVMFQLWQRGIEALRSRGCIRVAPRQSIAAPTISAAMAMQPSRHRPLPDRRFTGSTTGASPHRLETRTHLGSGVHRVQA